MTVLPDGRVLVLEQNGIVHLIKNDALATTNFYSMPTSGFPQVDIFSERGCLGITPDPDFANNGYVYLYCTVQLNSSVSRNRVLRVTATGDVAAPASETTILELPDVPTGVQWHMGGPLRFGADGKLYVAVGGHEDLRTEPPEASFSQNPAVPFGKILRINPDGTFPPDNPFANTAGAYQGNYVLGLRNPYAVDIQPGTGLIYINDVGGGSIEEINRATPGANFGWPMSEGRTDDPRFANAVYEYGREAGCAITGGTFYNPATAQFPATYVGKYLFSDYCSGWIRMIDPNNPSAEAQEVASDIGSPVALATAPDGSLYYLARNQTASSTAVGSLGKISFTNTLGPRLTQQPQRQTIFLGDPVTFSVSADGATGYQWQRNGADIPGATSASYTVAQTTAQDNQALFSVIVSNAQGEVASNAVQLTITTNRFPTAKIDTPADTTGFAPNEQINYAGTATDAEDGPLPASSFSWKVDFMHDTHSHPFNAPVTGASSGVFTVPAIDAEAANTWLRLSLSVADANGQTSTVVRDIYPKGQLSDMAPAVTPVNSRGPVETNRNNGDAAAGDGGPIALDGIPYGKGLGVYGNSEIRYNLAGNCTGHFTAAVGLDDATGAQGSVSFQVYLDDAKLFDSGLMRGSDLRKAIHVSVAGRQTLRLVTSDGGDGNAGDMADWAGARVSGCPAVLSSSINVPSGDTRTGGVPIALPSTGGSGGGGCSIGGNGKFDPVLPSLLALSLGMIGLRRRNKRG
jgi:glucose/arabinose dehydrogenase